MNYYLHSGFNYLLPCAVVCFVCDAREPAHYLIIQPDGAAQLCLQPEPRTRDNCERGLLLQTDDPFRGQARKTLIFFPLLSLKCIKILISFSPVSVLSPLPVWRAE